MRRRRRLEGASGILVGYTSRWNPLTIKVNVLVKVGDKTIRIPIDYRQQKFIQAEYAIGSKVEIERHGSIWQIKSKQEPLNDFYLDAI